ncbi:MAG: hypothetical protein H6Q55_468 [Deltaproteobacteria bacterium]|jgi:hypothetical protein|nr:hypothetical protein [Deltaproteobacteria bacterium]
MTTTTGASPQFSRTTPLYRAFRFSLAFPEGWADKTLFTLAGPVTDGIQHNITVAVDEEAGNQSLRDYADWSILALEEELKGCRVLKEEEVKLANGLPAYRVIFSWWPSDELRVYQEQVLVLAGSRGYRLTATFSKKTRKTVGPEVERMMFSFTPNAEGERH